jgi:hypothetical protein
LILEVWKQVFHATWNSLHAEFRHIRDDLVRHKSLVERRANIVEFEEIRAIKARIDEEFTQQRKNNQLNQRIAVRQWLNGARVEEDYEAKSSARHQYTGACRWIMKEREFERWSDIDSTASSVLWITGIPGAGNNFFTEQKVWTDANRLRQIDAGIIYNRNASFRSIIKRSVFLL